MSDVFAFPYDGHTRLVGVLGWPISHSLSPVMQNAALKALGINASYLPLPCPPEKLPEVLSALKTLNFAGANATIPLKEELAKTDAEGNPELLDELSPSARFTGTVNTVIHKDGKLYGDSTDAYGAFENLNRHGIHLKGKRVAILGNGGAARALAFELAWLHKDSIKSLALAGRNLQKVQALAADIDSAPEETFSLQCLSLESLAKKSIDFDIIINTTPLGMHPHEGVSPLPAECLSAQHIVYDIVYNPLMTQLLLDAEKAGATVVTGIGMLIHQGARSFEMWFDEKPDTELMADALQKYRETHD